jgi:hypothetical protein
LTVAILTISDQRFIETDLLKTGFLFEFSSFPCTFDRCLEPVLMIQQSYNGRDVNSPFHMEREVQPFSRNLDFQNTIAVYIFWKVGKQFKKKTKKPWDHAIGNTHIFFGLIITWTFIDDAVCISTHYKGPSWLWSYNSWIYNYLCNQCLSPLKLWVTVSLNPIHGEVYWIMW